MINAMLRLDSLSNLATAYGLLVIGKVVFLSLLGAAGWLAAGSRSSSGRRAPLVRSTGRRRAGDWERPSELAVALSRSAPPSGSSATDLGIELAGLSGAAPIYLRGISPCTTRELLLADRRCGGPASSRRCAPARRRGDRLADWPSGVVAGRIAALAFVTSGGPGVYGRVHLSAHMFPQRMSLMAIVPLLTWC